MPKKNEVDILLSVDDKATAKLNKAERQVNSFVSKTKTNFVDLAAKVYLVEKAVTGVVRVFGNFTKASQVQEDSINRLNTQLQLNGEYTDRTSRRLQDFAAEMQRATRFGDELVISQLAFAQAMGASAFQSRQIVTVAADMAASLNIELNAAVRNVAKTLGGFAGELGEVIPQLKNLTREQLIAGQGVALLSNIFSGAASKDVETFSGKVDQLKNAWGDLLENLGNLITQSPAFIGVINSLTEATTSFSDAIERMTNPDVTDQINMMNEALAQNPLLNDDVEFMARYNELLEQQNVLTEEKLILESRALEFARQKAEEEQNLVKTTAQNNTDFIKKKGLEIYTSLTNAFVAPIQGLILGSKKAKEALKEIGASIAAVFAKQVAEMIVAATIGKALAKIAFLSATAQANALAAIWATPAFLANVATMGGASAVGASTLAAGAVTNSASMSALQTISNVAIPAMADGGVVTRPTVALIGEAGPEAVVPLDRSGITGNTINISIGSPNISGETDISMLAEEIGFAVEDALRIGR